MFDIQTESVVCHQYNQYIEYDQELYHLPFSFDCQSESEVKKIGHNVKCVDTKVRASRRTKQEEKNWTVGILDGSHLPSSRMTTRRPNLSLVASTVFSPAAHTAPSLDSAV